MHRYARLSLLSVLLTAVMITVNHLYSLGPKALGLGAVLLLVPAVLLRWFRDTKSPVAFVGYLVMNLWIVVGFGLLKGFWGITLPLFLGRYSLRCRRRSPSRPSASTGSKPAGS